MLKKLIGIILLGFSIVTLSSCFEQPEENLDDDNNHNEEQVVEENETSPTVIQLEYENMNYDLTLEDLETYTVVEKEYVDQVGFKKTLIGIQFQQVFDFENKQIKIFYDNKEQYYSKSIRDLMIVMSEKISNQTVSLSLEDIYLYHDHISAMTKKIRDIDKIEIYDVTQHDFVLFDYRNIPKRYDYYSTLRTIQGIVNKEEPKLLTLHRDNPFYQQSDESWMMVLENLGYIFLEIDSLEVLAVHFKDYFHGIITFSDHFKSYNQWVSVESDIASMIAGKKNYLPVSNGLQGTFETLTQIPYQSSFTFGGQTFDGNISLYTQGLNITRAQDLYEVFFDEFKQEFHPSKMMSLTSEALDFAISEGMMFFDLKATQDDRDKQISRKIFQYFLSNNDYFDLYGWVDQEAEALNLISSYGGIINVVGSGNLSFFKNLNIETKEFNQKTESTSSYDENKTYVTFMASESDTIKVSYAFQHGAWKDEYRGYVPINWGMIADMSVQFPFIYNYFINEMSINDYFYSGGGSALGFVDIDEQMPLKSRQAIANANRDILEKADQHIIDMYNDRYTGADSFNKSILGSYFMTSQVEYAITRIHDGNTTIRIESWLGTNVYNRWRNFYPRRPGSDFVNLETLKKNTDYHFIQDESSDYWFLEGTLINSRDGIHFHLLTQSNGDGYEVEFKDGYVRLNKIENQVTKTLYEKRFFVNERKFKLSVEHSPIHGLPRIKLTINDLEIFDIYDHDNTFKQGGFEIKSEIQITEYIKEFRGSNRSIAMSVYDNITRDTNRFIVGYYGFMGSINYKDAQYRSEPGIGDVISLSPLDIYIISLELEKNFPNQYEITNLREFMEYSSRYFDKYQTLR